MKLGRLAQLVERHAYTVRVRGSSPLAPNFSNRTFELNLK